MTPGRCTRCGYSLLDMRHQSMEQTPGGAPRRGGRPIEGPLNLWPPRCEFRGQPRLR